MIQKDYLVRQAEQLGLVLGIILSKLLGLKNMQKGGIEIGTVNQLFNEQLDFDIDSLLKISDESLVSILKNEKGLDDNGLDTLADILYTVAGESSSSVKAQLYKKSLIIYQELSNSDKTTYSYLREIRINDLRNLLCSISEK